MDMEVKIPTLIDSMVENIKFPSASNKNFDSCHTMTFQRHLSYESDNLPGKPLLLREIQRKNAL